MKSASHTAIGAGWLPRDVAIMPLLGSAGSTARLVIRCRAGQVLGNGPALFVKNRCWGTVAWIFGVSCRVVFNVVDDIVSNKAAVGVFFWLACQLPDSTPVY